MPLLDFGQTKTLSTSTDVAISLRDALQHDAVYKSLGELAPRSVFIIGSCSDETILPSWWQDFDIHFLWDQVHVPQAALRWMGDLLDQACAASSASCLIDATLRDRHWKMTPDSSVKNNIGIHATLLNRADHFRRVNFHPILANNMYTRCRVLHGLHPGRASGSRPVALGDYLHGIGGLGWLAENFARAVVMEQLNPYDRSFAPFLGGYCWNVVGASLFHLYTLTTGGITGRHTGLTHALASGLLDHDDVEAARLVETNRLNPMLDHAEGVRSVDAAGQVLRAVYRNLERRVPLVPSLAEPYTDGPQPHLMVPGGINTSQLIVQRDESLSYWNSIEAMLAHLPDYTVSAKEDPEFLRDALAGGPCTKIRVLDSMSLRRYQLSDDFRPGSLYHTMFGWEAGAQAFLQRLNEWIVLGHDSAEVEAAARAFVSLAADRLSAIGALVNHATPSSTEECRAWLAEEISPHVHAHLQTA